MKILQTPARFYPYIGGVENYVHNLSRRLVRSGHEVTILCANEPKSRSEEVIDGIRVRRLPYIGKVANTNIMPTLFNEIMKEDFDLIHAHLPTPWSADSSALAAALKGKPLVLTYYNDIVGEGIAGKIAWLYNQTNLKLLLRWSSKIIILQPNYLKFSSHLKGQAAKVEAIPVGVDLNRFRPLVNRSDGNTLFFLSVLDRHHRYKGLEELMMSLVNVKEIVPEVRLIVGGGGELLSYYRTLSKRLLLEENVEFLGFVPEEMVAKCYNEGDIFVLPSYSRSQEGFGMVLLEAMACGKPVICTEISGVADDVRLNGAGIVVNHSNRDELVIAISYLLQKRPEALKMGLAGRRLVEDKYAWSVVARRVEDVYKKLVY